MRVGNINIVRVRAAFIATAPTASTTALSTATAGTLAGAATTLLRPTAAAPLIVCSHSTDVSAFIPRVTDGVVELCGRMHTRNEARKKLHSLVKICAEALEYIDLCGRDARIGRSDPAKEDVNLLLSGCSAPCAYPSLIC